MNPPIDQFQEEFLAQCKSIGINTDINSRWEVGTPHHPKSIALFNQIAAIDWLFGNDYLEWKSGGDGDNGETLMYQLDIIFERQDKL